MSTTFEMRRRVVFVDDDERFLETITKVLGALSQGQWDIRTARSAGPALTLLRQQPVHLIVLDVQMPVVDGVQMLRLLTRQYPALQKVVLTGFGTDALRAECLSGGADLFLEKPQSKAGFENLFTTLKELMKWAAEDGFRGVLRRVNLTDVVQMECLGRNSSVLEVIGGGQHGRIFIRDGVIQHAEMGDLKGVAAFNYLVALRAGEFGLKPYADPPEVSIEWSWEFLLMEAAQARDEAPAANAPQPGTLAEVAAAEAIVAFPPQVELPEPAPGGLRRIEEVFICSHHGDVIYEWQCGNSEVWTNFFEFLSHKSQRLSQGLPAGAVRRLESAAGGRRLIAIIDHDRAVIVRSRSEPV